MSQVPLIQDLAECRDQSLVGGKAINLGNLIRAGFPAPGGFVITTEAYRNRATIPDLRARIIEAYHRMGEGPVAVRSSATAEDQADASMAGQYQTFLGIEGDERLMAAVQKCWASLQTDRARAYLAEHSIDPSSVAMAVVVQKLVPADIAGVLFSANPRTGSSREMLIEASWGLGEAIVSGQVQPDVVKIDVATGQIFSQRIADKQVCMAPGRHELVPVDESRRRVACLSPKLIAALWELGGKAAAHFGSPQDIEWAIHDGHVFLLQSRAITTLASAQAYERLLYDTRAQLTSWTEEGRGPWVVHNLAETLPHPRPLTWSVIERFMSGSGGFGQMYRQAGFAPSEKVCKDGFLARLAGRPYMDASLAAEMFFENFPFRYDVEQLRTNPDAAQAPPAIPAGSLWSRWRIARKVQRINRNLHQIAFDLDARLAESIIPQFVAWCAAEKKRDLSQLSAEELVSLWQEREKKVMDEFAPAALLPSLIAAMALADLRAFLDEKRWDDDPDERAQLISSGHDADMTVRGNAQLRQVAKGTLSLDQWLAEHGHRAPEEFDLATPRWRERRDELMKMAHRLAEGPDPLDLHENRTQQARQQISSLQQELGFYGSMELDRRVRLAMRYLPYREDGKHYLMLGYDLLRDLALEAGRRLSVGDDVFHLTREELFAALREGKVPANVIAERKTAYDAESRITLPHVIDTAAIESIGRIPDVQSGSSFPAFAVSTGVAEGPARIVRSPQEAGDLGQGYILVCPSTDPGWTPLFVNAAGLILECGGSLSHGAVVARELNIPAVVLERATEIFEDGQVIAVDGRNGVVTRRNGEATESSAPMAPEADTCIPRKLLPPVVGSKELASATLRNWSSLIWAIYLVAAFTLPERWLFWPSMRILDRLFWPMVRSWGYVAAVAIIAAALAALTMILQWILTDNIRLLEAKRRSRQLSQEAGKLPEGSPRREAIGRIIGPVQARVAMAAMVPLAVLLGPMVMVFAWFPHRVDPASWNAAPGTDFSVAATIDGEWAESVSIEADKRLRLDGASPAAQALPPVRKTLEKLASRWREGAASPVELAGFEVSPTLAELDSFLKRSMPPMDLAWRIRCEPNTSGRLPITIRTQNHELTTFAVLGSQYPPEPETIAGRWRSPLKSLKIVYDSPPRRRVFWAPLSKLGGPNWDVGWLGVYLLAYVPAMFLFRRLLKIA